VLDSQGLRHDQELVFLSDGEESLRHVLLRTCVVTGTGRRRRRPPSAMAG
jgi:hypothetical protein